VARLGTELVRLTRRAGVRGVVAALFASAALVACGSGSGSTASNCPHVVPKPAPSSQLHDAPPPVPSSGAYLGAFALDGSEFSQPAYITSINNLQTRICRPLDIVHSFLQWQRPFPAASELNASRTGQLLLLSWAGTDTKTMASGADDAQIRTVANEIAALRTPVFLELRWEMDRPNLAGLVHSPADFIAAWTHTRALFAAAGVHNVSWVWCPTAAGFRTGAAQAYYPGAAQVDWVCADAYPRTDGPVESLQTAITPFLGWAASQGKPAMLGEFGVPQSYSADNRKTWLQDAASFVKRTPLLKALVYFDYDPAGHPAARTFQLPPGSEALAAFKALAADPWFGPKAVPSTGQSASPS
jgi:hypothetical protein